MHASDGDLESSLASRMASKQLRESFSGGSVAGSGQHPRGRFGEGPRGLVEGPVAQNYLFLIFSICILHILYSGTNILKKMVRMQIPKLNLK